MSRIIPILISALLTIASPQEQLLTSDYLLSLLEGAKINQYIQGSLECAALIRDSQYDIVALQAYFEGEQPQETRPRVEQAYFNVTGQLVKSIPDAYYWCYEVPQLVSSAWEQRLTKFEDIEDFSDGFFQNLLGNVLTIQDALSIIQNAAESEDYLAVVYQIGRLFRRMFDFQPMKSSPGPPPPVHSLQQCYYDEPLLLSNYSTSLSKAIMTTVGFTDGAFQDYPELVSNITFCRGNSVRFVRQVKLLQEAKSKLPNDTNSHVFQTVELIKSIWPFNYNCFYLLTESEAAYQQKYAWQLEGFTPDIYYEAGDVMDQLRTVNQIIEIPGEEEGEQLQDKHYYVIGRSAGVVYNILGSDNYDY